MCCAEGPFAGSGVNEGDGKKGSQISESDPSVSEETIPNGSILNSKSRERPCERPGLPGH